MLRLFVIAIALAFTVSCASKKEVATTPTGDNFRSGYAADDEKFPPFDVVPGSRIEGRRASDRIFFDYDSAVVQESEQKTLDRQVSYLKGKSDVTATVEGHCDERGTREYNLALGERRAQAVKKYLTGAGLNARSISTISYGKERPAVPGSDEASWAENRRAVTVLSKYDNK